MESLAGVVLGVCFVMFFGFFVYFASILVLFSIRERMQEVLEGGRNFPLVVAILSRK